MPESVLTVDDAGFRTLDPIARAKKIFNLSRVTVITDDFHAPRNRSRPAFSNRHHRLFPAAGAIEMVAENPRGELMARVQTVLDLFVLHTRRIFSARRTDQLMRFNELCDNSPND